MSPASLKFRGRTHGTDSSLKGGGDEGRGVFKGKFLFPGTSVDILDSELMDSKAIREIPWVPRQPEDIQGSWPAMRGMATLCQVSSPAVTRPLVTVVTDSPRASAVR